jgi:Ca2+-transporting ATPase
MKKQSAKQKLSSVADLATMDRSLTGMNTDEAIKRLKKEGLNELPQKEGRSSWRILLEVIREPMFLLLLTCGGIYLLLGEPSEAAILLGFVVVVIGITLYQENKTERALEALRDLSSPRALVVRDGSRLRIPGRDVVWGDLLIIAEGDRVAADAVLIEGSNIIVDESLLTGESVPVRKTCWDRIESHFRPGGDDLPFLFSGTLVVAGQGMARVIRTGSKTELGKIGDALSRIETQPTYLQKETGRVVRSLVLVGGILCGLTIIVFGWSQHDWLKGLLAGITLAMAILPEEFPVVLTIFLALGAYRLSRINVLTRRNATIETLGSATILCTDKTGTLTQNQMQIAALVASGHALTGDALKQAIPESHHALIEYAILASQKDPFDPMEKELHALGVRAAAEHLHAGWRLVKEYPLSKNLLAMSCVWSSIDGTERVVAAKGSPEAILDLCHLDQQSLSERYADIEILAKQGMRVLGVAQAKTTMLPVIQHDFDFEFVGFLGFSDPIRPEVPKAIAECREAGIQVMMITGDYPSTAQHIAQTIGLNKGEVLTGPELEAMTDEELSLRIKEVSICARVIPEQKLRIVNALKVSGEVVAMTGDGVNDAPALKASHIGVAMGLRGTDVARESADLVLLDDSFSSIVGGVRMGRRIFDNLRKAMAYILAIHVPIAGLSLLPILLQAMTGQTWPMILMPVHIVFLELIIDPACSVVFEMEPQESGVMKRKPRSPKERLFSTEMVVIGLLQGLSVLLAVFFVYAYALKLNHSEDDVRALAFTTLIFSNIGLILINRSWSDSWFRSLRVKNTAFWWVIPVAFAMMISVLYVPFLRDIFHFSPFHWQDLAVSLGASTLSILWFEIYKAIKRIKSAGKAKKECSP